MYDYVIRLLNYKTSQKQSKLRKMTRIPRTKKVRKQITSINSRSLWTIFYKTFKIILAKLISSFDEKKNQWKMLQTDSMTNEVFAVWIFYLILFNLSS